MKTWTIGKKLTACSGALVLLTMILSYLCISSSRSAHEMFEAVADKASRKVRLAGLLNSYTLELHRAQRGMIMYAFAKREGGVEMCRRDFQSNQVLMRKALGEYLALATRAVTKAEVAQIRSDIDTWLSKYNEISNLCAQGKPESAIEPTIATLPLVKDVERITTGFVQYQQTLPAESNRKAADQYNRSLTLSILMLALSAGIGGLALWVVRRTSRSLRQIADEMAQGAAQVAGAAGHVASSSQSLAEGASEQAASLEQTSASTEEINSMARRNTENSRTAADVVTRSGEKFTRVTAMLEETVTAMGDINTSSDKIANQPSTGEMAQLRYAGSIHRCAEGVLGI
jgi:methyl-accepting chemotaxis protein